MSDSLSLLIYANLRKSVKSVVYSVFSDTLLGVREGYPDIPWKRMIGLRNIVIHEYFGIDVSIIWEIVTRNLPQTKPLITQMLKRI